MTEESMGCEELAIEIDTQELKRFELQIKIQKPFEYGRNAPHQDYLDIADSVIKLGKVEHTIDVLKELQVAIISNRKHQAVIGCAERSQ